MTWLYLIVAALAVLPALNTFANLRQLRAPPPHAEEHRVAIHRVAILIPARNEETTIGRCVDAALASVGVDLEVIVLDDGSTDQTQAIVAQRAAIDGRLRIATAPTLPAGMKGKPHACQRLSEMSDRPYLLFVDADVVLSPSAAAQLIPTAKMDLVSGVPRQITHGIIETAIIPMINALILGYLPIGVMRDKPLPALAVACGQLIMVRSSAYRACGGHGAIAGFMHDGMQLAKLFRRGGYRTDLINAADLASCRMYDSPAAVFQGFAKNATEGMARPVALPVWTVLLGGGHLLSLGLSVFVVSTGAWSVAGALLVCATILLVAARIAQTIGCRESWRATLCHPLGVILTLAIQWRALYCYLTGRRVTWRGRAYAPVV